MHSSHPTGLSKCVACQQYSAVENFHKELVCLHCGHVAVVEGPPFPCKCLKCAWDKHSVIQSRGNNRGAEP